MKTRLRTACATVALAMSLFCTTGATQEPTATADQLGKCPDGHEQLRDVPIRYGMLSNDEQTRRDLAELKYVQGGCIVGKDSPKTAVICAKCKFRYQGNGVWHKSSTNADLFGKEFSPVLLDFLKSFEPEDTVHYDQTVKGAEVISQRVQFKCSRDRKSLDADVPGLMQRHGIRRDPSRYGHEVFYGSDNQASVYQVWVLTDRGAQLLDLSITSKSRRETADPAFETSDTNGGWSTGGYYVHNNMWNAAKYSPCTSILRAWSHDNWHVVTRMNNKTGDGAVKTYPNVHKDYDAVPIGSYESITSSFAETSPHVGIYNFAYDIWINGIARPGCTEIMIWTENFKQTPGGKYVEDVTFGNRTYKVYRNGDSGYIAFVAAANFTSGTVDLLEIMNWTIAKNWLPDKSTLDQICFGVEVVSTDDKDAEFRITAFSIDASGRVSQNAPTQ